MPQATIFHWTKIKKYIIKDEVGKNESDTQHVEGSNENCLFAQDNIISYHNIRKNPVLRFHLPKNNHFFNSSKLLESYEPEMTP